MICAQVLEFPQSSIAVNVLVIVFSCGQMPPTVTSENPMVGVASQLSVAVALPVTAVAVLELHCTVIFGGQVITGGALSSTKIVCAQLLELPQSSVALHVRVMVNSCGQSPPTLTSVKVGITLASQLSVAVADPVAAGAVLDPH
jgi:hypothetical protein